MKHVGVQMFMQSVTLSRNDHNDFLGRLERDYIKGRSALDILWYLAHDSI